MVPTNYYLILSAILFGLGVFAFIFKSNVITIFMSIELMLNAVNLAFVAFSQALGKLDGQVFVLFVIVVAAAEAAVGLGIIILIARNRQTLNVERVDLLKLEYLWIVPLLPLLGSAVNGLFGAKWPNKIVNSVAIGSTGLSFLAAIEAVREFFESGPTLFHKEFFTWIAAGNFRAGFDLQMDQLTVVMVLVVTGVGWLIHIYATGYMAHEGGYYRFFSYLNLFMFFMLILVLAANYV